MIPESMGVDIIPLTPCPISKLESPKNTDNIFRTLAIAIRNGCVEAESQLYDQILKGMRYWARNSHSRPEALDIAHDVFVACILALREGKVRDPAAFAGYVSTTARRRIALHGIRLTKRNLLVKNVDTDSIGCSRSDAEEEVLQRERRQSLEEMLQTLRPLERDILKRFYLEQESREKICCDLNISDQTFRLVKSRGKAALLAAFRVRRSREELADLVRLASVLKADAVILSRDTGTS